MGSSMCTQIKFGCVLYTQKGVRHKEVCTRVDSEGQKNCPSPGPARESNHDHLFMTTPQTVSLHHDSPMKRCSASQHVLSVDQYFFLGGTQTEAAAPPFEELKATVTQ